MRRKSNSRPRLLSSSASMRARTASSWCDETITLSPENATERTSDDLPRDAATDATAQRLRDIARDFRTDAARDRARRDLTRAQPLTTLVGGPKNRPDNTADLPKHAAAGGLAARLSGRRLTRQRRWRCCAGVHPFLELLIGRF